MNLHQFRRILIQVFLLPLLALAVLAGALSLLIEDASRTVGQIQSSDRRVAQVTLAAKLIVDQETGLRGYQVTGDRRFLDPFDASSAQLARILDRLEHAPDIDKSQATAVQDLRDDHAGWVDGFAKGIIAAAAAGTEYRDPELNMRGKVQMDQIRADLASITGDAGRRRAERIALWQRQVRVTLWVLFGLALTVGLFIGLFVRDRMHLVSRAFRGSVEEAQRRAAESFRSEQELRTTVRSIGDGVIRCDAEGRVQMMNPVAEELTGWPLEEAEGRLIAEVFPVIHEETRQAAETPVAKVLRRRETIKLANHLVLVRRDGAEFDIADSGAPILDKDGTLCGVVMVFRDVTLERRAQEALIAQEKLAVSGRVAATIAHEIHNPLDAVQNLLYLIRTGATEEETRQYLTMAEGELARVTQISRAMLGMYRESASPVRLNVRELLRDVLLLMERRFGDLGVTVDAHLNGDVEVSGYPGELKQVFSNLITNAAEASGEGGEVMIELGRGLPEDEREGREGALITVRDNGPGIDQKAAERLFQPFFTTKGEKGTGLGLWVSRGIVAKHGGTLTLRSGAAGEAQGTVAQVFLPLATVRLPKQAATPAVASIG